MGKSNIDFKTRLLKATNASNDIPEIGRGQQTYVAKALGVSQEAVRKWYDGRSTPRAALMKKLSKLLSVDYGWLSLGIDETTSDRNKEIATIRDAGLAAWVSFLLSKSSAIASPGDKSDADMVVIRDGAVETYNVVSVFETLPSAIFDAPLFIQGCCTILAIKKQLAFLAYEFIDITGLSGSHTIEFIDGDFWIANKPYKPIT